MACTGTVSCGRSGLFLRLLLRLLLRGVRSSGATVANGGDSTYRGYQYQPLVGFCRMSTNDVSGGALGELDVCVITECRGSFWALLLTLRCVLVPRRWAARSPRPCGRGNWWRMGAFRSASGDHKCHLQEQYTVLYAGGSARYRSAGAFLRIWTGHECGAPPDNSP